MGSHNMGNELVKMDKEYNKRRAAEEAKFLEEKRVKREALEKLEASRREQFLRERKERATSRLSALIKTAVEGGALETDPFWKKLAMFAYSWPGIRTIGENGPVRKKPHVSIWDSNLVIYADRDAVTGEFRKSTGFRIIGRILFAPGGGVAGVVVHDKYGCTMVAQGSLADAVSEKGWSSITDDFYLIEDDPRLANGAVPNG